GAAGPGVAVAASGDAAAHPQPDDAEVERLLGERRAARDADDFAAADAIRDRLADLGVAVEDTPAGPVWRRL
ncbi:MAG TPA: cysteine--tRNA ligase, partial [Acidimicrobiaceae bacterium]|nr:cysteine--tRNA ligase [Acidimicrobiaceae bacterium]